MRKVRVIVKASGHTLVETEHHYIGEVVGEDEKSLTIGSTWGSMTFIKPYFELVEEE